MHKIIKRNRLSAVSAAIRDVQSSLAQTASQERMDTVYTVSIANNKSSRQKAFALAYQVYLTKGYIPENSHKMLITDADFLANTCTINISEKANVVASITLNFQGQNDLPCQELYQPEIELLLQKNMRLVELTRLVIQENHRHSNYLLAQLFQAAFIYAYQIKQIQDAVIEVNPRHIAFYQRLLGFQILGGEKECERVNKAPAFLLHLDLNYVNENLDKHYKNQIDHSNQFKFFKFAMPLTKAISLKNEFQKTFHPMSFTEKFFFSIQQKKSPALTGAF